VAVDLGTKVYTNFECGLLGLAAHPDFGKPLAAGGGRVFVDYCTKRSGQTFSVVSELRLSADGADTFDPTSERVLLEQRQPYDNHNGGALAFGPDGFLYISFGDGGSGNDPLGSGQDLQSLLGKILRVDVDTPSAPATYAIPSDNPFAADPAAGRPELFAWGLRNPWRMSFDRQTGELWVGDVGQDNVEEIDIVERGKNYGWKVMEGSRCRPGGPANCDQTGLELPVLEYDHGLGRSVTGGYVYRGARVPALSGRYVFADYASRLVFAWKRGEAFPEPLMTSPFAIAGFAEDADGELYALDLEGSRLFRFEARIGPASEPPPERLSQTGCFADLATLTPAAGVLPYAVTLPFWSDGATKSRFLVLPEGGKVTPNASPQAGQRGSGAWGLPSGTVLIKHFDLATPTGPRRLETRFLIQEALGVRGFTYRWNEAGDDAELAQHTTVGVTFPVTTADGTFDWHLPARAECGTCHRGLGPLGLETAQVGALATTLDDLDLLARPVTAEPAHVLPADLTASLETRARAWLHVNCAYCHDGLGPSGTPLDLRKTTPLSAMAACDATPMRGDLGHPDARLITPGDPDRSLLWLRASTRGEGQMPPLASAKVDPDAALVREWIATLTSCPAPE
jgi:glucose/arabinose dehydrogenase